MYGNTPILLKSYTLQIPVVDVVYCGSLCAPSEHPFPETMKLNEKMKLIGFQRTTIPLQAGRHQAPSKNNYPSLLFSFRLVWRHLRLWPPSPSPVSRNDRGEIWAGFFWWWMSQPITAKKKGWFLQLGISGSLKSYHPKIKKGHTGTNLRSTTCTKPLHLFTHSKIS